MSLFSFHKDIWSIDMGSSNTRICCNGEIVLNEPTVALIDKRNNAFVRAGKDALATRGPISYECVHYVRGEIADYEMTACLLGYFYNKVRKKRFGRFGLIVSSYPWDIANVEERALRESLEGSMCRKVGLVSAGAAAAAQLGLLDTTNENLECIVDVGGFLTQCTIVQNGLIISVDCVRGCGGEDFDAATMSAIRKEWNVTIGSRKAQRVKESFSQQDVCGNVLGRKFNSHEDRLPVSLDIPYSIVKPYYDEVIEKIVNSVDGAIQRAFGDKTEIKKLRRIHLVGGSSQLRGLREAVERHFEVEAVVAPDPANVVVLGLNKIQQEPILNGFIIRV